MEYDHVRKKGKVFTFIIIQPPVPNFRYSVQLIGSVLEKATEVSEESCI